MKNLSSLEIRLLDSHWMRTIGDSLFRCCRAGEVMKRTTSDEIHWIASDGLFRRFIRDVSHADRSLSMMSTFNLRKSGELRHEPRQK